MELEWESRTLIPHQPSRDWQDRPHSAARPPSQAPPSSFISNPPSLTQRRRSSAAHTRPAAPPPSQPIPSIPLVAQYETAPYATEESKNSTNEQDLPPSSFVRPSPSPNLAAVVSFSHTSSSSNLPASNADASIEDLSDPPPQSILHPSSSRSSHMITQDASPGSVQVSRESRETSRVPSSRRALTRALELAREAVQLDATNDDPEAAVQAYGRSVALLSEVMERVRRGEDSTENKSSRRRGRSIAAQEEEIRRLQNIHDTYADRMNILSIIYSIPTQPYTSNSVYGALNDLSATISPAVSTSPSSESSPQIPQSINVRSDAPRYYQSEEFGQNQEFSNAEAMSSAMFALDHTRSAIPGLPYTSQHPYAAPYEDQPESHTVLSSTTNRSSIHLRRARAPSSLPPPAPPPSNSLPPAPASVLVEPSPDLLSQYNLLEVQNRQRGDSTGHIDVNSNRLEAVTEEHDNSLRDVPPSIVDESSGTVFQRSLPDTTHSTKRDSHPLPPLPSPTASPGTPRMSAPAQPPRSPRLQNTALRSRGPSLLTTRSEFVNHPPAINASTSQGTISQRRATRPSAPPTPRSSSPTDSTISSGSVTAPKSSALSFSGAAPSPNRPRSSSQPGRRPSVISNQVSSFEQPIPPLPGPPDGIGNGGRKSSVTSKFNPIPQPTQLYVQTDLPPSTVSQSLVPPSHSFSVNFPTTPISPLPPAPPSDPLLKPYHLMYLLLTTMTSNSGGYLTRRLHVPHEVWSQGGAKLSNVPEKVRVVTILCSALEDLQVSSSDQFGAGNVCSGMAMGIGSIGRKEADSWLLKLDEFSSICDGVVANFGKKLGVGEGFVLKKTTWSDKLVRSLDKLTTGKNLDSPAAYVRGLEKLFSYTQLLDEHTKAVISQPLVPAYAAFPPDVRNTTEQKLKRASEFFASVVLTFVIRDLSQLLDKYAKKCEKWLAE